MRQTAIVVAPGRGTYNRDELGYLKRHHAGQADLFAQFDAMREEKGQVPLTELDAAARFSTGQHTRGDNASGLIHACAYADFLAIDRARYDILGVTGNSLGWYIALACAGAVSPRGGFEVVNTMGTLMHDAMIGGQLIYPFVDGEWQQIPQARHKIEARVAEINTRPEHRLALSIDLGGMLVLAGNEAGLSAFEAEMPRVQDRFPLRLPGHAAFHTALQEPVAEKGRAALGAHLFGQPALPLIDGRGAIWRPGSSDPKALHTYTLGHQIVEPYRFADAIRVAAREFMPDVFIVLGPGGTLGSSVCHSLLRIDWRRLHGKADFQRAPRRVLSMGHPDQRTLITRT